MSTQLKITIGVAADLRLLLLALDGDSDDGDDTDDDDDGGNLGDDPGGEGVDIDRLLAGVGFPV